MNRSLFIIFATIALDAIGIGLIFPILPLLLQDMTHSTHICLLYTSPSPRDVEESRMPSSA